MWTATGCIEPFVCGLKGCHSEVHDLDIAITIHEDILRLEVAMTDVEAVAVGQASDHLAKYAHGLWFWETAIGGYVIEEFSAFYIF